MPPGPAPPAPRPPLSTMPMRRSASVGPRGSGGPEASAAAASRRGSRSCIGSCGGSGGSSCTGTGCGSWTSAKSGPVPPGLLGRSGMTTSSFFGLATSSSLSDMKPFITTRVMRIRRATMPARNISALRLTLWDSTVFSCGAPAVQVRLVLRCLLLGRVVRIAALLIVGGVFPGLPGAVRRQILVHLCLFLRRPTTFFP